MPQLKHARTGVVVNVSDGTAARLIGYEPVQQKKAEPKKAAAKKSSDDE